MCSEGQRLVTGLVLHLCTGVGGCFPVRHVRMVIGFLRFGLHIPVIGTTDGVSESVLLGFIGKVREEGCEEEVPGV